MHLITKSTVFYCKQNNCKQTFSSVYALRRHLQTHVSRSSNELNQSSPVSVTDTSCVTPNTKNRIEPSLSNETPETSNDSYEEENSFVGSAHSSQNFFLAALKFVLSLCNYNFMSLKEVFNITGNIKALTETIGTMIPQDLNFVIDLCKDPFKEINTESKLLRKIENLNFYKPPIQFTVDTNLSEVFTKGIPKLKNVEYKRIMMAIEFMFESVFSLPNLLNATLKNMEELSKSTKISNFINGSVWNDIKKPYVGKTVIPYNLYFDDFEPDNPLGSHKAANSIGAFYIGFPTMPQFLCSRLQNIFPVMFIKSSIMKDSTTDKCLQDFVNVLLKLENEGVIVNHE